MQRREDIEYGGSLELCAFCYPSRSRDVLFENDDVYVMPSLGSFTAGYLLLISRTHRDCVADVATPEFVGVKERIGDVLDECYGDHCFFEHGRIGSCYRKSKDRICFHAHLHCLPVSGDILGHIEEDFDSEPLDTVEDLRTVRDETPHYLYVEATDGRKRAFTVDEPIERQYLRKKACETLGLPAAYADWKRYPFEENMRRTTRDVSRLLRPPLRAGKH